MRGNPMRTAQRMFTGGIERTTLRATMKLPLEDADKRVTGHEVPFWKRWMDEAIGNDAFWQPLDHTHRLDTRTPPVSFASGWYDFMLDQLLRDYATLVDAGRTPQLTIGPWFARQLGAADGERAADARLDERKAARRRHEPARQAGAALDFRRADRWRDFDAYPRWSRSTQIWHVHPDSVLSQRPVRGLGRPIPTPTIRPIRHRRSAARCSPSRAPGPVDQAPLEQRKDVLVYTSEPLFSALTIPRSGADRAPRAPACPTPISSCGSAMSTRRACRPISATASSARPRPTRRCPTTSWKLNFRMHATAHRFNRNHRLRVIVASGAHPRYARNTGTDEALGEATARCSSADIEVFHDPRAAERAFICRWWS